MSVVTSPLASFSAVVTQVGSGVSFAAGVNQIGGTTLASFTAATTYTDSFVGVYDNASSRVRWTGVRLVFDGSDLHPSAYYGRIAEEETMVPGQQRTMRFSPIGHLWAIPTDDYVPPPGTGTLESPTGSETPPSDPLPGENALTPFSPRSWGNKDVELHLSFGASPRTMVGGKLFQGVTLQKSNHHDVAITGDITCVDESIKYANIPLCYEIAPFGGMTRDAIVRALASNVGVPPDKVFVPAGSTVTKPILLSNGSLLPFVNELGSPENWFAYFDKDGNFVVEVIELKDEPDWTIDARRGDYDYEEIEETPPSMPPTRYYASGTVPVTGTTPTTTPASNDITGLYNPQCVKVRPSGGASNLQADGSYRTLAAPVSMVIGRVTTAITAVDGRETSRVVITYQMYNPLRYDPNYDSSPPGTSYDGAYGDKTFHRNEVESLIEVRRETTTNTYDTFGTLQRRVAEAMGWYAPKVSGNYPDRLLAPVNAPGHYVFPGGTSRRSQEEEYLTTGRLDIVRNFAADGTLARNVETTSGWLAPQGRCDLTDGGLPDGGVPGGGGVGTSAFEPSLIGPVQVDYNNIYHFDCDATGIPGGVVASATLDVVIEVEGFHASGYQVTDPAYICPTWLNFQWVATGEMHEPGYGWVAGSALAWPMQVYLDTAIAQNGPIASGKVTVLSTSDTVTGWQYRSSSAILTVTDGAGNQYASAPRNFDVRVDTYFARPPTFGQTGCTP